MTPVSGRPHPRNWRRPGRFPSSCDWLPGALGDGLLFLPVRARCEPAGLRSAGEPCRLLAGLRPVGELRPWRSGSTAPREYGWGIHRHRHRIRCSPSGCDAVLFPGRHSWRASTVAGAAGWLGTLPRRNHSEYRVVPVAVPAALPGWQQ